MTISQPAFLSGLTCVLASNTQFDCRTIPGILRNAGARSVHVARRGEELIDILESRDIDTVVIDELLDNGQGLQNAVAIRDHPRTHICFLPIVYLLTNATRRRVFEAAQSGVHEVVTKPYSARTLLDRLYWTTEYPRPFVRNDDYFGPQPRNVKLSGTAFAPPRAKRSDLVELED